MSSQRLKKIALICAGALAGGALTLSIQAYAEKDASLSALPLNELRTFAEVFGRIKQDYVEPVDDKKLINDAIKGMLTGLDPHSDYMTPDEFKDLREKTQGEFGGLGIEIGAEDGLVKVVAPYEDTPAQKAGIKSGDFIVKIDDTPVRGLSLTDAVKRMRGKPGTKVTLTIARKNADKPIVVTLTRAIIRTKSVKFKLIEPGYGYVRVTQFQEHTAENLASAIQNMYTSNKGDLKGLVLDLRDDPGGLLNGAVGVAAAFLPKDTLVVYTQGRTSDSKMHLTATLANYANADGSNPLAKLPQQSRKVPMVVLVNGGSASASEIVAGALQDSKRALILGTQTFGKGSVQSILPLTNDGGIRLTTSRYFTPSGRSIQAKGITPDILADGGDSAYQAFSVREADLEGHLANPNGDDTRPAPAKPTAAAPAPASDATKPARPAANGDEPDPANDYQLSQALNTLKVQQLLMKKAASQ
ncbi:S41 family peptidase [Paludibacterium purpuratum]|uniref:Carboxyl-terminal processing protease n=1 Tax=Paludibacterium purpuratum TaxID=1144873 RepID=A0A4R7BD63_9NEIS|nr:S41 family peptidase [Paludibacterium purpuratum]TDR81577.1 carboxyl-terminal processing protease [Paludibacterium purpuratum]